MVLRGALAQLALLHGVRAKCHMTSSLGCLAEPAGTRVLTGFAQLGDDGTGMDLDHCAQICQDHQFTLAGVEDGHQCFCGNSTTANETSHGCTAKCASNSSEICGGGYCVNVYEFACAGPPSPPLPGPQPQPGHKPSPNLCPDFSRDYCKAGVPVEQRIEMLMSHMTMDDKIQTMGESGIAGKFTDGTNLAARSVSWWNEALHGVCRSCQSSGKCFTQFPEAVAMSCSFNATLWRMIGDTISTEARAAYNVGGLNGLTFFAPQLNMAANPLWGRNMECVTVLPVALLLSLLLPLPLPPLLLLLVRLGLPAVVHLFEVRFLLATGAQARTRT